MYFVRILGNQKNSWVQKKVNKKLKNVYFVKIKTTKNIKNYNIDELKKVYYKICRKKLEIKEP